MKKFPIVFAVLLFCIQTLAAAQQTYEVSRIEFIAYLMSARGIISSQAEPGFYDLSPEDRYYSYAAAAKEYGVCGGYEDGSLRPNNKITREDAVVMLCRAYKIQPSSTIYISGFSDFSDISAYAAGLVSAAARNGIIKYERGTELDPKGYISIEEMTSLCNAFEGYSRSFLSFSFGYPAAAQAQTYKAITLSIKTTRACTVYYRLIPSEDCIGGYKPKAREITEVLTAVSIAGKSMDVNIYPPDNEVYNVYTVAKGEDGAYSDVEVIKNVTAHRFSVGDGTKESPYEIYTAEQLAGIGCYPKAYYSIEQDIQLSGTWEPIEPSHGYLGFAGELEGNYHHITGLNVKKYSKNAGLFSAVYGGKIKNLYVDGEVRGKDNVGIITGLSEGGSISGCFVTGRVLADGSNGGGICGVNNGEIINSVSAAYMVEASAYAGGIAGANHADITSCLSAAYTVSADMYAGGVAGVNVGGRVNFNVAAGLYADDIITTRSGRITTNKQYGTSKGNYCYDKLMSDGNVNFDYESPDGLEATWQELTDPNFYSEVMGWDTDSVWGGGLSADFRLALPRGFDKIDMIKGITIYAPAKIYTEEELMAVHKEPNYHYILMCDIRLGEDAVWQMIGDGKSEEMCFNGSFDGNGHTISGLHTEPTDAEYYGMFGVISAGTVRNLKLCDVSIEGHSVAGGIAGANYGYIENCSVDGKIYILRKNTVLSVGGVCGNNYGFIENARSGVTVRADGEVLTAGGIAANNEGLIYNADFSGKIKAEQRTENSNAVVGGICGINTDGEIYNACSRGEISSRAATSYVGGICGITNGGKLSENSGEGKIYVSSDARWASTAYTGGIAGLVPNGIVTNSRSAGDIFVYANMLYVGGIAGYNQNAVIQNTYTLSALEADSGIFDGSCGYVGGICGYSEGGVISENVAASSAIKTNAALWHIASTAEEAMCTNNYYDLSGTFEFSQSSEDGEGVTDITAEFFLKPIADGGRLGWSNEVWSAPADSQYPVLSQR